MAIPTFNISAGIPSDLQLRFVGFATYQVAIATVQDGSWIVKQSLEEDGVSHGKNPLDYAIQPIQAGKSVLLFIPIAMASPGGDTTVSATAEVLQNGASKGKVATPTFQPGDDSAGNIKIRIILTAV